MEETKSESGNLFGIVADLSNNVNTLLAKQKLTDDRLDSMARAFKGIPERLDQLEVKKAAKAVVDESTKALIRKVAAQGSTDEEFATLMHLSGEYNLDPLKKEIWFMKYNGKATIITSRDGYLKIANADPSFDGMEGDVVYIGDTLTKRDDTSLHIVYGENHFKYDKNQITGAFCNIYRKDRSKPTTVFVSFKDYKKESPIWNQYTNAMILKVAESMALKRAFALSGLASSEELEDKGA